MNSVDAIWQHFAGRDRDGDRFSDEVLIHGNGQALALIACPITDSEWWYRVYFKVFVPEDVIKEPSEIRVFVHLESAKQFVIETLSKFDPLAAPKPKATTKTRSKVKA